jgi:hypothetical protein
VAKRKKKKKLRPRLLARAWVSGGFATVIGFSLPQRLLVVWPAPRRRSSRGIILQRPFSIPRPSLHFFAGGVGNISPMMTFHHTANLGSDSAVRVTDFFLPGCSPARGSVTISPPVSASLSRNGVLLCGQHFGYNGSIGLGNIHPFTSATPKIEPFARGCALCTIF